MAAPLEELGVRPLLDDVAVFHDEDEIRVTDGREPVGDDEAGTSLAQVGHGFLDEHLGSSVHRAGGLVEDEQVRGG